MFLLQLHYSDLRLEQKKLIIFWKEKKISKIPGILAKYFDVVSNYSKLKGNAEFLWQSLN